MKSCPLTHIWFYSTTESEWIEQSAVFLSIQILLYVDHTQVNAACWLGERAERREDGEKERGKKKQNMLEKKEMEMKIKS